MGNSPARQGISVSLSNVLDLKIVRPKKKEEDKNEGSGDQVEGGTPISSGTAADTAATEEEEDVEKLSSVITWNLSSSYDPQAPKNKGWKNVSSRVNLGLFGIRISMNQSFEPYERKLLSTNIDLRGIALKGNHPFGLSKLTKTDELNIVAAADTSKRAQGPARERDGKTGEKPERGARPGADKGLLPWSVNMDLSYDKSRGSKPRATLNMRSSLELTPAWRISYGTHYDIEAREFRGQDYGITRDLHCWEMSFTRRLYGDEWQYYFKINLRAHPEIYAENGLRGIGGVGARSITSGSMFQ